MAVLEGTWTTPRAVIPSGPMLVCSEGVITCVGGAENQPDVKAYDVYGNELEKPEMSLGEEYKDMPHLYAWHLNTGNAMPEMVTAKMNVKIMAILDAMIKSSETRREEEIDA